MNQVAASIPNTVQRLADIFLGLNRDYVLATFGVNSLEFDPTFDHCVVAVCEDGDVSTGRIGGTVDRWWDVSGTNIKKLDSPGFQRSEEGDDVDRIPVLKIYVQGERFVLGERYCSTLSCRRLGQLTELDVATSFAGFPTVWRSSP